MLLYIFSFGDIDCFNSLCISFDTRRLLLANNGMLQFCLVYVTIFYGFGIFYFCWFTLIKICVIDNDEVDQDHTLEELILLKDWHSIVELLSFGFDKSLSNLTVDEQYIVLDNCLLNDRYAKIFKTKVVSPVLDNVGLKKVLATTTAFEYYLDLLINARKCHTEYVTFKTFMRLIEPGLKSFWWDGPRIINKLVKVVNECGYDSELFAKEVPLLMKCMWNLEEKTRMTIDLSEETLSDEEWVERNNKLVVNGYEFLAGFEHFFVKINKTMVFCLDEQLECLLMLEDKYKISNLKMYKILVNIFETSLKRFEQKATIKDAITVLQLLTLLTAKYPNKKDKINEILDDKGVMSILETVLSRMNTNFDFDKRDSMNDALSQLIDLQHLDSFAVSMYEEKKDNNMARDIDNINFLETWFAAFAENIMSLTSYTSLKIDEVLRMLRVMNIVMSFDVSSSQFFIPLITGTLLGNIKKYTVGNLFIDFASISPLVTQVRDHRDIDTERSDLIIVNSVVTWCIEGIKNGDLNGKDNEYIASHVSSLLDLMRPQTISTQLFAEMYNNLFMTYFAIFDKSRRIPMQTLSLMIETIKSKCSDNDKNMLFEILNHWFLMESDWFVHTEKYSKKEDDQKDADKETDAMFELADELHKNFNTMAILNNINAFSKVFERILNKCIEDTPTSTMLDVFSKIARSIIVKMEDNSKDGVVDHDDEEKTNEEPKQASVMKTVMHTQKMLGIWLDQTVDNLNTMKNEHPKQFAQLRVHSVISIIDCVNGLFDKFSDDYRVTIKDKLLFVYKNTMLDTNSTGLMKKIDIVDISQMTDSLVNVCLRDKVGDIFANYVSVSYRHLSQWLKVQLMAYAKRRLKTTIVLRKEKDEFEVEYIDTGMELHSLFEYNRNKITRTTSIATRNEEIQVFNNEFRDCWTQVYKKLMKLALNEMNTYIKFYQFSCLITALKYKKMNDEYDNIYDAVNFCSNLKFVLSNKGTFLEGKALYNFIESTNKYETPLITMTKFGLAEIFFASMFDVAKNKRSIRIDIDIEKKDDEESKDDNKEEEKTKKTEWLTVSNLNNMNPQWWYNLCDNKHIKLKQIENMIIDWKNTSDEHEDKQKAFLVGTSYYSFIDGSIAQVNIYVGSTAKFSHLVCHYCDYQTMKWMLNGIIDKKKNIKKMGKSSKRDSINININTHFTKKDDGKYDMYKIVDGENQNLLHYIAMRNIYGSGKKGIEKNEQETIQVLEYICQLINKSDVGLIDKLWAMKSYTNGCMPLDYAILFSTWNVIQCMIDNGCLVAYAKNSKKLKRLKQEITQIKLSTAEQPYVGHSTREEYDQERMKIQKNILKMLDN